MYNRLFNACWGMKAIVSYNRSARDYQLLLAFLNYRLIIGKSVAVLG